jgi:hypothetical protein
MSAGSQWLGILTAGRLQPAEPIGPQVAVPGNRRQTRRSWLWEVRKGNRRVRRSYGRMAEAWLLSRCRWGCWEESVIAF